MTTFNITREYDYSLTDISRFRVEADTLEEAFEMIENNEVSALSSETKPGPWTSYGPEYKELES